MNSIFNHILAILFFLSVLLFPVERVGAIRELPLQRDDLGKVKELLKEEDYDDAISLLKRFDKDNSVPDLILFYTALAKRGLGNFEESNDLIHKFKKEYPDSPLINRVTAVEARNNLSIIKDSKDDQVIKKIESFLSNYVESYPKDFEVSFLFAKYLKGKGDAKKAEALFLRIYQGNSPYSEDAFRELGPSSITAYVLVEKAKDLIREREYRKAEGILEKALSLRDGTIEQEDILGRLGLTFFMQKKYDRAAWEYTKAGDLYNAARSLFRKGDIEAFDKLLSRLIDMKDKRAGSLILALASKNRRDGNLEEALRLFEYVKKEYPHLEEDALWGIAWSFYRVGRYSEAKEILSRLNEKFPSRRYAYWLKRCHIILDKGDLINDLSVIREDDFYSIITYFDDFRIKDLEIKNPQISKSLNHQIPESPDLLRFHILASLGFQEEAITELVKDIKNKKRPDIALKAGYYLQQVGAYGEAIRLTTMIRRELNKVKDEQFEDFKDIMYPLAFWPVVESASKRFDIDPFLLLSIMREESRFEPEAKSTAGAIGLMQLMPMTAKRLVRKTGLQIKDNSDIREIKTNITIGAFYLKELIREFGSTIIATAAYNAGEERVRDWLNKGRYRSPDEFVEDIPYEETRNYVKRVLTTYIKYRLWYTKKVDLSKEQ